MSLSLTVYAVGYDMGDTVDVLALYTDQSDAEARLAAEQAERGSSLSVVPMYVQSDYHPPESEAAA